MNWYLVYQQREDVKFPKSSFLESPLVDVWGDQGGLTQGMSVNKANPFIGKGRVFLL